MQTKSLFIPLIAILCPIIYSSDIPLSRCLETRVYCQSLPSDPCLRGQGVCTTVLMASPASDGNASVEFRLYGKVDKTGHYFSMGLSSDGLMGNDSVPEVYIPVNGTHPVLRNSWNAGKRNVALNDTKVRGVEDHAQLAYDNGIVSAKWVRSGHLEVSYNSKQYEFDLKNKQYYILLAEGPVGDDNKIQYHTRTSSSSSAVDLLFTNDNALKALSAKCNQKSEIDFCFSLPDNCFATTSSQKCQILLAVTNHGFGLTNGTVSFQMIGTTDNSNSGWIAVGLSDDSIMGNDSVIDCLSLQNGSSLLTNSWNEGHKNLVVGDVEGVVSSGAVVNENGLINCRWTRSAKTEVKQNSFDLLANKYHLLLAKGSVDDKGIKRYHSYYTSTVAAINLTSTHS